MRPLLPFSIGLFVFAFFFPSLPAHAEDVGFEAASGTRVAYRLEREELPGNTVTRFALTFGPVETGDGNESRWYALSAEKGNGQAFTLRLQGREFPPRTEVARYLFQEADAVPLEYTHLRSDKAVLPEIVSAENLWPRPLGETAGQNGLPARAEWLGQTYVLETTEKDLPFVFPGEIKTIRLQSEVRIGVPSNSRTKDDTRRYDGSDYEMVRLTREDYEEMIRAGLNCLRTDAEQAAWIQEESVFYWGPGGGEIAFPESLFRSNYLGPVIFFDEPGVSTRDYDIRPRLEKEPDFRKAITPQIVLEEFKRHYHRSATEGPPFVLMKGLQARPDVDLGALILPQRNLYIWETIVPASAWELTAKPEFGPQAFVFEPPGRIGSMRTLPEWNMSYGCQLFPENPAHFADVIFGFLRGAARVSGKGWGISIYGAVDRADAPWLLTHAYDLGATHFYFWDNYQSACVPRSEYLALTRHLWNHVQERPERNLERLKNLGETVILLPPGYDLGHIQTGRGNLWGLGELNLERKNRFGIKYRQVMGNFFTEIERCLRLGVPFDLLWDLDGLKLDGYSEIVRIREDGDVEVIADGRKTTLPGPRIPERAAGAAPELIVDISPTEEATPFVLTARAHLKEGSAPIYYTTGTDRRGEYPNVMVLWELYGPDEEDYRTLSGRLVEGPSADGQATLEAKAPVSRPGHYRLRAATTDLLGRTHVVWSEFDAK